MTRGRYGAARFSAVFGDVHGAARPLTQIPVHDPVNMLTYRLNGQLLFQRYIHSRGAGTEVEVSLVHEDGSTRALFDAPGDLWGAGSVRPRQIAG